MHGLQCGDPIHTADGIAIAGGNDVVALRACEQFTRFRADIAARRQNRDHAKMIVETTPCAREAVRRR